MRYFTNKKMDKRVIKWTCSIFVICLLILIPGCKNYEKDVTGNWGGVLTIEMFHEAGKTYDDVNYSWTFSNKVTIDFQFFIDTPLSEAQIDGEGDARQEAIYSPSSQCVVGTINTPMFKVSVYGTVDIDEFNFHFVPDTIPIIEIAQNCGTAPVNIPTYSNALVDILSGIQIKAPTQDGYTYGGSGLVTTDSHWCDCNFSRTTYIYSLKLNRQ